MCTRPDESFIVLWRSSRSHCRNIKTKSYRESAREKRHWKVSKYLNAQLELELETSDYLSYMDIFPCVFRAWYGWRKVKKPESRDSLKTIWINLHNHTQYDIACLVTHGQRAAKSFLKGGRVSKGTKGMSRNIFFFFAYLFVEIIRLLRSFKSP